MGRAICKSVIASIRFNKQNEKKISNLTLEKNDVMPSSIEQWQKKVMLTLEMRALSILG